MAKFTQDAINAAEATLYEDWMNEKKQATLPDADKIVDQFKTYNQWLAENHNVDSAEQSPLPKGIGEYTHWLKAAKTEINARINANEMILAAEATGDQGTDAFILLDKVRQNVRFDDNKKTAAGDIGSVGDMYRQAWFDAVVENMSTRYNHLPHDIRKDLQSPPQRMVNKEFYPNEKLGRQMDPDSLALLAAKSHKPAQATESNSRASFAANQNIPAPNRSTPDAMPLPKPNELQPPERSSQHQSWMGKVRMNNPVVASLVTAAASVGIAAAAFESGLVTVSPQRGKHVSSGVHEGIEGNVQYMRIPVRDIPENPEDSPDMAVRNRWIAWQRMEQARREEEGTADIPLTEEDRRDNLRRFKFYVLEFDMPRKYAEANPDRDRDR